MNILDLKSIVAELFSDRGLSEFWSSGFALTLLLISFLVLGRIIFWVTRKVIAGFFIRFARSTASKFDDILIQNKVPKILSYLPVLFLYYETIPTLFTVISQDFAAFVQNITEALLVVLIIALIRAVYRFCN